ncbi:MAG: V-type ATP synthase subunit E family protein [Hadesarchaea archaeon]|nr:V-type ATP synthase subunit E family protein [Hadesarchaea archaeon]
MRDDEGARLIVDEILKETREKTTQLIEAAQKEARSILNAARLAAKEEMEREVREAKTRGEQMYRAMLAEGRVKAKKEILRKREELINEVFERAKEKLVEYTSSERYERDLIRIAAEACKKLNSDKVVIHANKRDLKLLERRMDELIRAAGKLTSVSLGEPIQTMGGVRVGTPDGKMEVDDTLEARMNREFEALRIKVAKVLFEGST